MILRRTHSVSLPLGRFSLAAWLLALASLPGCGDSEQSERVQELLRRQRAREAASINRPAADEQQYRRSWGGFRSVTVAPGVHALGLSPSAAYAIETSEGVILVDAGVDEQARPLRESLALVGLSVEDVRYVLITHAHYDHVFGVNEVRRRSGATVCAGKGDCETLRRGDRDALFSVFPRTNFSGSPIVVDRELADGDVIALGDTEIEVMATPGHTPGSVCYSLRRDGRRLLFCGDVIASLSFGPATYPVHLPPAFRGSAADYLQTIERLLAMQPPDMLLTGHPQQQRQPQALALRTERWNRLLRSAEAELREVLARRDADGADFLDGVPKRLEAGLYYLGDLDATAVYWTIRGDRSVLVNAPGGDRLGTFIAERLRTLGLTRTAPDLVLLTSAEPSNRSGLASLSAPAQMVQVVAPFAEDVALELPVGMVRAAEQPPERDDAIASLPLGGSEGRWCAYRLQLDSRDVLITPALPRQVFLTWTNRITGQETTGPLQPYLDELQRELASSPDAAEQYRTAMRQLAELAPDLWLPALPVFGQNANLYDEQWRTLIEQNLALATAHR